jgi:hypothetical protein
VRCDGYEVRRVRRDDGRKERGNKRDGRRKEGKVLDDKWNIIKPFISFMTLVDFCYVYRQRCGSEIRGERKLRRLLHETT